MRVVFHRNFEKQYKKLRAGEKERFKKQRNIFLRNPFDPALNNHPLQGKYKGYRSISVGGDLRVVYKLLGKEKAYFVAIDTHSKLYSS